MLTHARVLNVYLFCPVTSEYTSSPLLGGMPLPLLGVAADFQPSLFPLICGMTLVFAG